jgi:starch synthase
MKVLMVSAELTPLAKTGGLGDAVHGLSDALAARGHDVRVLLPRYAHLPPPHAEAAALDRGTRARFSLLVRRSDADRGSAAEPRIYLADLGELTGASIYAGDARDGPRFLKLAEAALDFPAAADWTPDIYHCHDWHPALVPALQRAQRPARPVPTVLTLHNIGYQGVFGRDVLAASAHPGIAADPDVTDGGGEVNFLRAGVRTADALTTVSPTYAKEVRTPEFGMGLEALLDARGAELTGILNGVDYATWGPATDPYLDFHYDAGDPAPKYEIKASLCGRLGLDPDRNAPLIGVVSRIVSQKGIDLIAAALPTLLGESRASCAVLGSGDPDVCAALRRLAAQHPRRVSFTEGYDEPLAHRILAGSDVTLVPSRYEPCGLTQMYALRYGTVPVVRRTGGLADTVEHFDPATGRGNGAVFRDADVGGVLWGTRCALAWFDDAAAWSRLMANGMAADFSWHRQVGHYESLYRSLLG